MKRPSRRKLAISLLILSFALLALLACALFILPCSVPHSCDPYVFDPTRTASAIYTATFEAIDTANPPSTPSVTPESGDN